MNDKLLAASAYFFGIPALYIVLTEKRKDEFVGAHGAAALFLWVRIFTVFFLLRLLVDLVWRFRYVPDLDLIEPAAAILLWGHSAYQGLLAARGASFHDTKEIHRNDR